LWNVEQDNVAKLCGSTPMSGCGADVAGADDRDFRATHGNEKWLVVWCLVVL
jgi:hypothetical protein